MKLTAAFPYLSLLITGLMPLVGVLFLGWNIYAIVFLFWLESLVAGVFNLIKMILAREKTKFPITIFFVVHFGVFIIVTGGFVVFSAIPDAERHSVFQLHIREILTLMVLGYTANLITQYIMNGAYKTTAPMDLFFAPYGRIFILGIIIMSGVFLKDKLNVSQGTVLLIVLTVCKFIMDLFWTILMKTQGGVTVNLRQLKK
ncbi:MAG: DUF6498-containing protein [Bacteroidetes bacterium]|nr:DUF6498-containing protein [Bacteroidota bacterium]